jgi:hypothetical protein
VYRTRNRRSFFATESKPGKITRKSPTQENSRPSEVADPFRDLTADTVTARFSRRARVVELVDTRDLKSLGGNPMRVRFPPRAYPYKTTTYGSVSLAGYAPLDAKLCPNSAQFAELLGGLGFVFGFLRCSVEPSELLCRSAVGDTRVLSHSCPTNR